MEANLFSNKFPTPKQKDIALYFLHRLRSSAEAKIAVDEYSSAISLAHMVSRFDNERLCASIHVHLTFVRIVRNEKGSLGFPCTTFDHVRRGCTFEEEDSIDETEPMNVLFEG